MCVCSIKVKQFVYVTQPHVLALSSSMRPIIIIIRPNSLLSLTLNQHLLTITYFYIYSLFNSFSFGNKFHSAAWPLCFHQPKWNNWFAHKAETRIQTIIPYSLSCSNDKRLDDYLNAEQRKNINRINKRTV